MSPRVLHVLSQRPALTGSGVTLDATVRQAARAGWSQRAVVGIPADDGAFRVGDLPADRIDALRFQATQTGAAPPPEAAELDFPVPGMSDVMPYRSTIFGQMTPAELARYRTAWRRHLKAVLERWRPDVIHAHHVWLVAALLKDIAPQIPVVNQCHATGLRQLELCPHLGDEVRLGCRRNERFLVLHDAHGDRLAAALQIARERIVTVGAGYDDQVFRPESEAQTGRTAGGDRRRDLIYVGKLSFAKGLPQLLDAVERCAPPRPTWRLHVAGAGAGAEAADLRRRLEQMAPTIVYHGQIDHAALARLLRRCHTLVLPSFYEGVPLVLVEAVACGCRVVATALPGIQQVLAPHLAGALELVGLPRLIGVDTPDPADLAAFTDRLAAVVMASLDRPVLAADGYDFSTALAPFTWTATFARIERVWHEFTG